MHRGLEHCEAVSMSPSILLRVWRIRWQPRDASSMAMAWPIPLAEPVTTATRGGTSEGIDQSEASFGGGS